MYKLSNENIVEASEDCVKRLGFDLVSICALQVVFKNTKRSIWAYNSYTYEMS